MEGRDCLICMQAIRHPICERCYIKEVISWMRDMSFSFGLQRQVFERMKNELVVESPFEGYCLRCYNEVPNICSYCFFYKVAGILKEEGVGDEILKNFLEIFNYRHYDEEYVL